MTTDTKEELYALKERANKLARDKSYLQLVIQMTSKLGEVGTLENVVLAIPTVILSSIGGTNIKLYYFIDNKIYYCDAFGEIIQLDSIDDETALNVKKTQKATFVQHDFSDTMMIAPEFEKAWNWTYPLTVGDETIGVLKMENLHIGVDEWSEYLPIFFNYAALLLKNEIFGYTKLQKAYNDLYLEVETRKQTEEELERANNSLIELTGELETKVEERTRELSESNKKFQVAAELAKIAYWEYDIKNDLFVFNDRFYDVIHHSSAKNEGGYIMSSREYIRRYVHPDDSLIIPMEIEKISKTKDKLYASFVQLRILRGSSVAYMAANFRLSVDSNDMVIKAIGACQDVTEQKMTQLEVERTSSEWVQAMDAFDDMIYLLDANRHLIRANKKFYTVMNLEAKHAVGKLISELTHPNLEPESCLVCAAQTAFSDKVFIMEADDPHNPTSLPLEATVRAIRDEAQKPVAILTSLHDLSCARKVEQELRVLNESLELRVQEELSKNRHKDLLLIRQSRLAAMGEMITNIAHQWRQPLNALAITIQDIKYAYDENELNEAYIGKTIKDSMKFINYMSHTIDDFRTFFKPDKQKERFSALGACELAVHVIADALKNSFIEFEVECEDKEMYLIGYPHEFSQVILNLLSNSKDALIEHRCVEPRIALKISKEGDNIQITVKDNGGGIKAEILDRAFDPYFTTKEQGKGMGLGLYMSKMIIEQHMNGKIYAYNDIDGACFVLELTATA